MSETAAALVIAGPTAAGKTALALLVAPKLGAEILSMDAGAVYRGMDIGTAKPTKAERAAVPHHLVDVVPPTDTYSVARWLQAAAIVEADLAKRGKLALYVGGTPLYLKALLEGLFPSPPRDAELRKSLEARSDLHAELAKIDPESAKRIHPNDKKRLIRAIEIHTQTGRPISALQAQWGGEGRPARIVLVEPTREVLRERIAARSKAMLAGGLIEEASRLAFSEETKKFIGYAEAIEVKAGRMPREEAEGRMAARTWTLVRRQQTWFRKLRDPLRLEGKDLQADADKAIQFLAGK